VLLRPRSQGFKELEIVVLRHELSIFRRQGPGITPTGRASACFLSAANRLLPRSHWSTFIVSPATLLR
jgi:hypothetical protein